MRSAAASPLPAIPVALAAIAAIVLTACGAAGSGPGQGGGDRLTVVATTTQIADLVREVGGGRVEVNPILTPNSDPHTFEPRPDDVAATAEASLIFASGLGLDPWAEKLIADSGSSATAIDLSQGLPALIAGDGHEHGDGHDHEGELDPHWWQNPINAAAAVERIGAALAEADPDRARAYRDGADRYRERIETLDRRVARCLARIPAGDRRLVTDHEAFGYFADRYGLEVVGAVIPALTTNAQASARDLKQLSDEISAGGVKAIFPESTLSPKLAEAIAAQTGASAERTLYGDSLGPEGAEGATYLGMIAANARAIAAGLSGGRIECRDLEGS